jgi:hypothetical protein
MQPNIALIILIAFATVGYVLAGPNMAKYAATRGAGGATPATPTWAFLYHFDEALGSTSFADAGYSNIAAVGNSTTVVATNAPDHPGFGNSVYTAGTAKRVHIGADGLVAPGTNEFFIEGWFYLTAAQAATNYSCFFVGQYTNAAVGLAPFFGFQKIIANGGRFDIAFSTNGNAAVTKTASPYDMSALGDSWVHIRAGRITNVWAAWVNGTRMTLGSASAAGVNIVFTNSSGGSMTCQTIGGRAAANSPTAADDVGYWIGSYGSTNFTPPTSPRTGYETAP